MKTPDEIKTGLSLHRSNLDCYKICPYDGWSEEGGSCIQRLMRDTVEYIEQIESRLAQAERERDAAVFDLGVEKSCYTCEHGDIYKSNGCYGDCIKCEKISCPCENCRYKWRGVCEENTKED